MRDLAAKRVEVECGEVGRVEEFLPDRLSAERGIGAVVGRISIVVGEADESHILYAVALVERHRKDYGLRQVATVLTEQSDARIVGDATWNVLDPRRDRLRPR